MEQEEKQERRVSPIYSYFEYSIGQRVQVAIGNVSGYVSSILINQTNGVLYYIKCDVPKYNDWYASCFLSEAMFPYAPPPPPTEPDPPSVQPYP